MPLFSTSNDKLDLILPTQFDSEKQLQSLVERNLDTVFSCRFVATEYMTGAVHGGRIDTLALTEDGNPAIIEYKKAESSDLINQSLFYLSWLNDHRGDFQVAAEAKLGSNVDIDWSDIRVICIAPGYKKYDLHAVQQMGANIELWRYRLFGNSTLLLEDVYRQAPEPNSNTRLKGTISPKDSRRTVHYSWDYHMDRGTDHSCQLAAEIRDYCLSLSDTVEQSPKKFYVAYKVSKNFCCMEVQRKRVLLYLRLNPNEHLPLPPNARDVTNIGHYGTGDFELSVNSVDDLNLAREYIERAFNATGGS